MTSEKNFVPLIKQALTNIIGTIEFKKTNSTALLSLRILSSAILALCRDAFSLLENNRISSVVKKYVQHFDIPVVHGDYAAISLIFYYLIAFLNLFSTRVK